MTQDTQNLEEIFNEIDAKLEWIKLKKAASQAAEIKHQEQKEDISGWRRDFSLKDFE